jgi:hypothetical protein
VILRWTGVLGLVGFLSGFIGPMVVAPDANQGPMVGIFLSGPGGVVLGALLGAIVRVSGASRQTGSRLLAASAAALAAVTLYFCIPAPRHLADVVVGEARSCVAAESLKPQALARLAAIEASRPERTATAWGEKFDRALAGSPGVVVEVHVRRARRIDEAKTVWSRGELLPRPWTQVDADTSYFVEAPGCGGFSAGSAIELAVYGVRGIWPPYTIAEFLDMQFARPLPDQWAGFVRDR